MNIWSGLDWVTIGSNSRIANKSGVGQNSGFPGWLNYKSLMEILARGISNRRMFKKLNDICVCPVFAT